MAKLEVTLSGSLDEWVRRIEEGILQGSVSASLEDGSDFISPDGQTRCCVRVFERFSWAGSNRVSLNVTLFQNEPGVILCSAISSGGSQAKFFKINTIGEENFLDCMWKIVGT
ncbi:MAG: hypothetical protein J5878_05875 [Oscillospiraceae bacterium]|nr:hypothetical protein [Oscillospiraceae bacterium]MBO4418963.1 hypothetical protein [Oscillospiraceae bacterium]